MTQTSNDKLPRWGVASTIKAPRDKVWAFVAHHLDLGAHRIWLHFDQPDDPAADDFAHHPRVTTIRCDEGYWAKLGRLRPDTHQKRQIRNVTRVLRNTKLDWVAHLDVDEFLLTRRDLRQILAEQHPNRLLLRAEPWEALHDPDAPPDIYTSQRFRRQSAKTQPYGAAARLLDRGMLSHTVGKCLFRTNIPQMVGRIHGARINGAEVPGGPFHPDLTLLHFHAEDREDWLARLPFRLKHGAYQYRPAMQAWLLAATPTQRAEFYDQVQNATPQLCARLHDGGLLRQERLDLTQKIARHLPELAGAAEPLKEL